MRPNFKLTRYAVLALSAFVAAANAVAATDFPIGWFDLRMKYPR